MNMSTKQLEQLAIDAHEAGDDWATFWQSHAADVAALEPDDYFARGQLIHRLVALVASGDTDGQRPRGIGPVADSEPPSYPGERRRRRPGFSGLHRRRADEPRPSDPRIPPLS